MAQPKAQLSEQASDTGRCQRSAYAAETALLTARVNGRRQQAAAPQVDQLKVQLTQLSEQASNAAACQSELQATVEAQQARLAAARLAAQLLGSHCAAKHM